MRGVLIIYTVDSPSHAENVRKLNSSFQVLQITATIKGIKYYLKIIL